MLTNANIATDAADVIQAVAALGWVVLAGAVIYLFRRELRSLIGRIRRIHTPLGDAEMEVTRLEAEVDQSVDAISQQLPSQTSPVDSDVVDEIQRVTAQDPALGLIELVPEIEVRVRDLASIAGHEAPGSGRPWGSLLDWLVEAGIVPKGVASSQELIRSVRNKVVHGDRAEIDDRQIAASVDAGLRLLRVLEAIPRDGYEVAMRPVEIFKDEAGEQPYGDVRGVVLWAFDAQGERKEYHVYPTLKGYSEGERVGWQWSFDHVWEEAYWRDPYDEMRLTLASSSSAEFVGERLIRQPGAHDFPQGER